MAGRGSGEREGTADSAREAPAAPASEELCPVGGLRGAELVAETQGGTHWGTHQGRPWRAWE